jgi:alcohol-forming fatty acyl-CoA reductase
MSLQRAKSAMEFYSTQTVFLTGSTGGLGGCLLYMLALVLRTLKIYILVRGSDKRAVDWWTQTMPEQWWDLVTSGSIEFVVGDMKDPMFGIGKDVLEEMKKEVTLIIHAAANISSETSIGEAVADNCLPSLRLAGMASEFENLDCFVQVSTAYANSFLPDGPIEEKIYPLSNPDDPEAELRQIRSNTPPRYLEDFPYPCVYSKHLTERLLISRFPSLPLLIIRPTCIGPAISHPYELYGSEGSCPISALYSRLMDPVGGINLWHAPKNQVTGTNRLDEIPVDLVAKILFQHVLHETRGIIHASSLNYIPKTMNEIMDKARRWAHHCSFGWGAVMARNVFTTDKSIWECQIAKSYKGMLARDWQFDNTKSRDLEHDGPLSLDISNHDVSEFTKKRVIEIFNKKRRSGTTNQITRAKL